MVNIKKGDIYVKNGNKTNKRWFIHSVYSNHIDYICEEYYCEDLNRTCNRFIPYPIPKREFLANFTPLKVVKTKLYKLLNN